MKKILIVYDTKEGQTQKIARFMADQLKVLGWKVDCQEARTNPQAMELNDYEGVIVGGPVHYGKFPKSLRQWVQKENSDLAKKPWAFFSICLGVLQKDPKVQEKEKKIVEDFFTQVQAQPVTHKVIAGSLAYTKYGFFKKFLMKRIASKAGGSLDTTVDHEYTDWQDVRLFVHNYCRYLEMRRANNSLGRMPF